MICRNEITEKQKAFWKAVDEAAARVAHIPDWRIDQIGFPDRPMPNAISSFNLDDWGEPT